MKSREGLRRLRLAIWLPVLCLTVLCSAGGVCGEDAVDELQLAARRILQTRCVTCHGSEQQEGGLRLDSAAAMQRGGDRAAPESSAERVAEIFLRAISGDDSELQMPPKQPLTAREQKILRDWVNAGAAWGPEQLPDGSGVMIAADVGDAFTDPRNPIRLVFGSERLQLWSLRAPEVSPAEPTLSTSPGDHPIDAILAEELALQGLGLSVEADRRTLIRRVTVDLTGLLPTPDEVDAFCRDTDPGAWERVVDRLLASPEYGQRQARLWLDVVRYADTNGYERDEFRPLMWKYRDYVIRAFNEDKPYDQFVREQLAGDELVRGTPQTAAESDMLTATGFLRLGQWDSTAAIFQEESRLQAEVQADLTNTTAAAFLGLTMSCCQCHDHKYDPFTQADHYRLRAFFAATTPRDDVVISTQSELTTLEQENRPIDEEIARLKAQAGDASDEAATQAIAALEGRRRAPELVMGVQDRDEGIPAMAILLQGDHASPGAVVEPGFPSLFDPHPAKIPGIHAGTSGRRLALANWIVSESNPWTARVFVNRLWQQHFGVGLVATANDLGHTGARPVHQRLLDWLAMELPRRNWSVKEMHRLIVTSRAYRQSSSAGGADDGHLDPENRVFWRQNVRRLDAESLRDCLLQVSGLLRSDAAGPPRWPPVAAELRQAQPAILEAEEGKDEGRQQGWYAEAVEATDVRSLFLIRKRCLPIPFLQVFDLPDSTTSCARRDETVVAPQSIMLLNSPETVRYSRALAARISTSAEKWGSETDSEPVTKDDGNAQQPNTTDERLVKEAFRLVFQRVPDAEELRLCCALLEQASQKAGDGTADAPSHATTELCRSLLNTNEFVYID